MRPPGPSGAARRLAAELQLRRRSGAIVAASGRAAKRVGVPEGVLVRAGTRLRRVVPWELGGGIALIRANHEVFDTVWYLDRNPDVAHAGMDPVRHYLLYGAAQRRSPHPLFDTGWYLDANPDVAEAGINPLVHYLTLGAAEGRNPHPLFDSAWYLETNPDVAGAGVNPLVHYLRSGAAEGRSPHPLFDSAWYVDQYPEVLATGFSPLVHYLFFGGFDGKRPNPWFDSARYLNESPDVAATGANPLVHYVSSGAREGRRPGPLFDTEWYLARHPEVAETGEEPLRHFCAVGRRHGWAPNRFAERDGQWEYLPERGEVPWVNPVSFVVDPVLAADPKLNVLVPSLGLRHMSGGPNTALQFVARLAIDGERVRLISTDQGIDDGSDLGALWRHISRLTGIDRYHRNLEVVDGSDSQTPVAIGEHDVFFATAFWTAQAVKAALPLVRPQRFLYLVQDFEPGFFAASSQYALALETYSLDHFPIVNTQILFDYLVANRIGRFGDPEFTQDAVVFQPSVDRFHFYVDAQPPRPRRLLFYARPTAGLRNMFELGVAALRLAQQRGVFADEEWTFLGMGDRFDPVALSGRDVLEPAPWLDFEGYAEQMRQSDVLLSLMLAPHPSYPPLEMAACGGLVVTNSFDVKTADRLDAISSNIVTASPTIESIASALATAVERLADVAGRRTASRLTLPEDWDEAVLPLVPRIRQAVKEIRSGASRLDRVWRTEPEGRYDAFRLDRIQRRADQHRAEQVPGLLSFITPVWNTDPEFLRLLAESVFGQDGGTSFEWVVLDNGSDDPATLAELDRIARHPSVRFVRCDANLGIIGGMRRCLEAATGRYIAHLDHDDLLAPDAVLTVTAALLDHDEPALFYSDEDKLRTDVFFEPYFKPDWDPVLLANSCYVSHLCGARRDVALALGAYDDPATATSPDWDLFVRAHLAGHVPLHIPEVLYSWRVHAGSTAGDISTKATVGESHRAVLGKLLAGKGLTDRFDVVPNPHSPGGLDGWLRRRRDVAAPAVRTVVLGDDVSVDAPIAALQPFAAAAMAEGARLHLRWAAATPVDDEWPWEAAGLFELFPDVAAVGGPIDHAGRLVTAGEVFGFGRGCDSPDAGRGAAELGWMVTLPKQRSVSAVSPQHLVADAGFVAEAIAAAPGAATVAGAGMWLGAHAARRGRRVVYSPHLGASVTEDLGSYVSDAEQSAFNIANADLLPDTRALSPRVGLARAGDLEPATDEARATHVARLVAPPPAARPPYGEWLRARIAERASRFPIPAAPPTFAVITPVYAGTPVALFDELAGALASQTLPPAEWLVASDGPVPAELEARLHELVTDGVVRYLPGPRRGILATMRAALEAATADYVTPIDADDLVTVDALAVLASALVSAGRPALVFSDEDIVDGRGPRDPFLRPDWDPVLHHAGSYIWHLIAYEREAALAAGILSDAGANWCHDWDTVDLLTAAGHVPLHVPEVLYHWRHHDASSTNTADPNAGSQQSVRHVMERMIARTAHPERYDVEAFPIDRGAREWYITRREIDPPAVGVVVTSARADLEDSFVRSVARTCSLPLPEVRIASVDGSGWAAAVAAALRSLDADVVVVASDAVDLVRHGWLWEAVKLLELHPDVAVVTGRIVDARGRIVAGGEVADPETGELVGPLAGLTLADPGPYAFALKPQLISAVTTRLFVADRVALLAALDAGAGDGPGVAATLAAAGRSVAYTPLIEARIGEPDPMPMSITDPGRVMGLAGFDRGQRAFQG